MQGATWISVALPLSRLLRRGGEGSLGTAFREDWCVTRDPAYAASRDSLIVSRWIRSR